MDQFAEKQDIRDLASRYAYYVDTFQTDKIMELWTEDAVFDESRVGTGLHRTAAGIRLFFEGLQKVVTHQAHLTANHLIDTIEGDSASGIVYALVEAMTSAGPMRAVVYYADDYRKVDGRWRFASRVIHPLMPFDTSALAAAEANIRP